MKKISVLFIASLLFISFAGISFAQQGAVPAKAAVDKAEPAKEAAVKEAALTGKVTAIDTAKNQITIQSKKVKTTLDATAEQIKAIKVGEKIKVALKADGKTVDTIEALAAKGKK
jgi:hypothetical protein